MGKLLLLFIVVPAVELVLLIKLGGMIGLLPTLAVIVLTGTLGASLARWQGLGVLGKVQSELARGGLPAGPLVDGVIILVAGALLMTPGFFTDIAGFLFLVPGFRGVIKKIAKRRFERAIKEGTANVFMGVGGPGRWREGGPDRGSDPNNIEM